MPTPASIFPTGPYFLTALLCKEVRENPDMQGAHDIISSVSAMTKMTDGPLEDDVVESLVLYVRIVSGSLVGTRKVSVLLSPPKGDVTQYFPPGGGEYYVPFSEEPYAVGTMQAEIPFRFRESGVYCVLVALEGDEDFVGIPFEFNHVRVGGDPR